MMPLNHLPLQFSAATDTPLAAARNADINWNYYMPWHQWESQGQSGENRRGAVLAMKFCLARNTAELDLCGYSLRDLPIILPPCLRLYCDIHPAPSLPQFNTITYLPPIYYPSGTLPEYLPAPLTRLNLNDARASRLFNLSAERDYINNVRTTVRGQPERRRAVRRNHGVAEPSASLPRYDNIAHWLPPEQVRDAEKTWGLINKNENTSAFNNFLQRLAYTISALEVPALKLQIARWIDKLSHAASLRQLTFAIAEESTQTCEDRISLTYIEMQKAELIYDIDNGEFDGRLPALIAAGRHMFRLEQLEDMAAAKAAALTKAYVAHGIDPKDKVDVIGIYLAYQVALNVVLNLSSPIEKMRFFHTTGISIDDLKDAELTVQQSENQNFASWLAQWSPWLQMLQRVDAKGYMTAIAQREHDLDNVYDTRVETELAALGLDNDNDARAAIGKKVMDEISGAIHIKLTIDFLKNKNLLALLDKPWQL